MLSLTPYRKWTENALYHPFRELEEFERNFFSSDTAFRTDIEDEGDQLVLSADLPGFKKDDIHVDVEDKRLIINAERHSNYEQKDSNYLRCERSYGSYCRSFNLDGIDAENIGASYVDGVLKLTLPKQKPTKHDSRRLEIQ